MIPAGAAKKAPTGFPNQSIQARLVRLTRMAVAFLVVAGSLGLATVTATAQSNNSSCPSTDADAYADLTDENNYAYDDSRCLKELGIPAPGDNYRPDDDMTRSEMARFMARTYALVTGNEAPVVATNFTDVSADDPNADDIARIFGLGITTGTTPTTYSPDSPVIRGHMALFLARLYKKATGSDAPRANTPFIDISARSSEQETAIGQIYRLGVTTGTTTTTYSPGDDVTRRQMASFVARMYSVLDAITSGTAADAPTDLEVSVSGTDGTALEVNWTAPDDTGSSDIVNYLIQWKTDDTSYTRTNQHDTTATSATFDDLTAGETYTFRVAARTAVGLGDWSDEASGNPATVPDAPTGVEVAISGDVGDALDVSWTAPEDSGSHDVTGYVVQWKSGDDDFSADNESSVDGTSATIDGLTKGTVYTFRVAAVNVAGLGDWSADASGNPATAPDAPTGVEVAISGDVGDALDVSWTAPEDSGSHDVTGYVVQWKSGDDDFSADNESSVDGTSATIDGLTKGTVYTFRVAAVNVAGQGDWSDEASGNPATAPGLVSDLRSTPRNALLALRWTAPADDGGSEITGYVISWKTGRQSTRTAEINNGDATSYTITGLRNSTVYSVWVQATNAAGTGDRASAPTGTNNFSVTPAPNAPTAPQDLTVTPGNRTLTLNWKEPADDGGTTFTGYTIENRCGTASRFSTASGSPQPHNTASAVQTITIHGLANGTHCDVRVAANSYYDADRNNFRSFNEPILTSPWAQGFGTPATLPFAPTNVMVTTAHESLQASWAPPTNDGGSDITGYKLTWSAGIPASVIIGNRTTYTITGLDNRFAYTVSVKTITDVGESTAAFASGDTQPRAVPATPRNVQVNTAPLLINGNTNVNAGSSLVVTWDAPQPNGTNPVDGYVVQRRDSLISSTTPGVNPIPAGQWFSTGVGTVDVINRTVTIAGLQTGRSYDIRVQATNDHDSNTGTTSIGGPWAMGSGTPATAPAAVTPTLEPGHTSIIASWIPPADNGSDITHYLIRYAENLTGNEPYSTDIRVNAPATRARITGLKVGVPYVVQVQAVNAIGTGPNPAGEIQTTTGLFPDAPTSVRAVPTPNGNGSTLTVTWNRVTRTNGAGPVSSYIVETLDVTNPGNTWIPTLGIDGNTTTAVVNVIIGRTYLVRVKAVALNTGISGYIDAPVKAAGSPPTPALLAATLATDARTIKVVWTAVSPGTPSDIISYTVSWFSTTDPVHGARGAVLITSNTRGTYSIHGLPSGSYTVQVVATNHIGNSPPRTANIFIPARS